MGRAPADPRHRLLVGHGWCLRHAHDSDPVGCFLMWDGVSLTVTVDGGASGAASPIVIGRHDLVVEWPQMLGGIALHATDRSTGRSFLVALERPVPSVDGALSTLIDARRWAAAWRAALGDRTAASAGSERPGSPDGRCPSV